MSRRKFNWWLPILALALLGAFWGVSLVMAEVLVQVKPKEGRIVTNSVITIPDDTTGLLETVSLEETVSRNLPVVGIEKVTEKASGRIAIFNNHSSAPQALVAKTRFETPDGKVYRIDRPVTVPGTKVEGGKTVPGTVEVTVYADMPGADYNIERSDFTIPGFKDDPRFKTFYARTKTPLAGGFIGEVRKADPDAEREAREELKSELKRILLDKLRQQTPVQFVAFDDGLFFFFEERLGEAPSPEEVMIKETARVRGLVFDRALLSHLVADAYGVQLTPGDAIIANFEELEFKLAAKDTIVPGETKDFSFSISGLARLVWQFNEVALKNDLIAAGKKDYAGVFSKYQPAIEEASIHFRPPWIRRFPSNPENIRVEAVFEPPNNN